MDSVVELSDGIIRGMAVGGFPVTKIDRPSMWGITEKAGSYESRISRFLASWIDPSSNFCLGTQPLTDLLEFAAHRGAQWSVDLGSGFNEFSEEKSSGRLDILGRQIGLDRTDIEFWLDDSACLIEVKMWSDEHNDQLNRYYKSMNERAKEKGILPNRIGFIYLTVGRKTVQAPWINVTYEDLLPVLDRSIQLIKSHRESEASRSLDVQQVFLEDFHICLSGILARHDSFLRTIFLSPESRSLSAVAECMLALDEKTTVEVVNNVLAKNKTEIISTIRDEREIRNLAQSTWLRLQDIYATLSLSGSYRTSSNLESIIRSIWTLANKTSFRGLDPNTQSSIDSFKNMPQSLGMNWVKDNISGASFGPNNSLSFTASRQGKPHEWTIGSLVGEPESDKDLGKRKCYLTFTKKHFTAHIEPYGKKEEYYPIKVNDHIIGSARLQFDHFRLKGRLNLTYLNQDHRLRVVVPYDQLEDDGPVFLDLLKLVSML